MNDVLDFNWRASSRKADAMTLTHVHDKRHTWILTRASVEPGADLPETTSELDAGSDGPKVMHVGHI